MVHSRKSKSNSLLCETKRVLLAHIKPDSHLVIALSGGIDSVVLLHLLAALSKQMGFALSAVHVNHGISNNAAHWSQFCCELCRSFDIPITVKQLNIKKEQGISLEALARDERYQVFSHLQADYIVLAQHLDDQAETLLLQLFRGAGVKGLSAMPVIRKQHANTAPQILRPLLQAPRSQIEAYAKQNELNWIHDESNDSTVYNRNFLRHKILPLLKEKYPNYPKTLLRTSQHLSEASVLLDELAEMDSKHCLFSGKLQIAAIHELSLPRARNLLRFIFTQHDIRLPSTAKLADILQQLLSTRTDTQRQITVGHMVVRCYKGLMYILPKTKSPQSTWQQVWQGEHQLHLKDLNGMINFSYTKHQGQGINEKKLLQKPVTIRLRQGGERFSPRCNRPRRSLKNLLQETSIPPWERNTLPLLFSGEKLVWVPGIGIDCEYQVKSDESGLAPAWRVNLE
jgi:tRNA(Ile)-lysidine synthase